jgi:hypothetical protein
MEQNNKNDILGIDEVENPNNSENFNRPSRTVPPNELERFANTLYYFGVTLYVVGVIIGLYLFPKIAGSFSREIDADRVTIALIVSGGVLFYHIVLGIICQGLSMILNNITNRKEVS